jgi:hypothetical protein
MREMRGLHNNSFKGGISMKTVTKQSSKKSWALVDTRYGKIGFEIDLEKMKATPCNHCVKKAVGKAAREMIDEAKARKARS